MKIPITFLMLIVVCSAAAQEKPMHKKHDWKNMDKYLPSMTRSLGGSFQQFDKLNGRVANLPQYKSLKGYTATLGLGVMREMNKVVSDMNINIGSSLSAHRDRKSSTIHYIGFNANIGYNVLDEKLITLYPFVGLGYQMYQAIFYRDNTGVNFDDVLRLPLVQEGINPIKFNNDFLVYHAGIGILLKSERYPSNAIGLKAGYTGSFRKNGWRSKEGQVLNNAPKDGISQFYFSLVLSSAPWQMMRHKD
ncbi:MAG: hypothetical protein JST63_13260 [Bacteroidetes bacterium]|nr:hypothetical protein [Bacteroidota bacterium]